MDFGAKFTKTNQLFLKLLSFIYLFAFASVFDQIELLYSKGGLLPIESFIKTVRQQFSSMGQFPTIFLHTDWIIKEISYYFPDYINKFDPTSFLLYTVCSIGILLAILNIVSNRFISMFSLFVLWFFYLSFQNSGQVFFSFQWDILQVETGFIAMFMVPKCIDAPKKMVPKFGERQEVGEKYIWEEDALSFFSRELQKFLFFRQIHGSGVGKQIFKCPAWWNLSSIKWHLSGMPIPHIGSWWASLASDGVKEFLTALTLFVMIFASVGFYAPIRTLRMWCLFVNFGTLCGIFLTGNFNFFPFLALVLLASFLDDQWIEDWVPTPIQKMLEIHTEISRRDHKKVTAGKFLFEILSYLVWIAGTVFLFNKLFPGKKLFDGNFTFKPDFTLNWLQSKLLTSYNYNQLLYWILGCTVVNALGFIWRKGGSFTKSLTFLSIASVLYYVLFITAIPHFARTVGIQENESLKLYNFHKEKIQVWEDLTRNYHLTSSYGLFRVMTGVGARPEFVIQYQSPNKRQWTDFEFRDKVGPLDKMPRVSAPHQARVEWQLWFTALDPNRGSLWLHNLVYKLLLGDERSQAYVGLDQKVGDLPTVIKFTMYKYWLNSKKVYEESGNYWRREVDRSFDGKIFHRDRLADIRQHMERWSQGTLLPNVG